MDSERIQRAGLGMHSKGTCRTARRIGRKVPLALAALVALLAAHTLRAQLPDADVDAAKTLIGKPLILRGMYLGEKLAFDANGEIIGSPKTGSFTLCGLKIMTVKEQGREVEFTGLRAALSFDKDRVAKMVLMGDYPMTITVDRGQDAAGFDAALNRIFSSGMSTDMVANLPDYWQHFFDRKMMWPPDGIVLAKISTPSKVVPPQIVRSPAPEYNDDARREGIGGISILALTVDTGGVPRQISIVRPLGFGLDENAVKAVSQYRFTPATENGTPITVRINVQVNFHTP